MGSTTLPQPTIPNKPTSIAPVTVPVFTKEVETMGDTNSISRLCQTLKGHPDFHLEAPSKIDLSKVSAMQGITKEDIKTWTGHLIYIGYPENDLLGPRCQHSDYHAGVVVKVIPKPKRGRKREENVRIATPYDNSYIDHGIGQLVKLSMPLL